jgi:hypothetical protein
LDYEEQDHDQDDQDNEEYVEEDDKPKDDKDNQNYDRINKEEIKDLIEEAQEDSNPNQQDEDDNDNVQEASEEPNKDETACKLEDNTKAKSQGSKLRRSTRASRPVLRLKPTLSGQSYLQAGTKTIKKKVKFVEDELRQLEYCHNLISQVKPDESQTIEYGTSHAMVIVRLIQKTSP